MPVERFYSFSQGCGIKRFAAFFASICPVSGQLSFLGIAEFFHRCERRSAEQSMTIGVFTLGTRGWVASEFLTRASKFNMTPNGDRPHIFDAGVNFLTRASPT